MGVAARLSGRNPSSSPLAFFLHNALSHVNKLQADTYPGSTIAQAKNHVDSRSNRAWSRSSSWVLNKVSTTSGWEQSIKLTSGWERSAIWVYLDFRHAGALRSSDGYFGSFIFGHGASLGTKTKMTCSHEIAGMAQSKILSLGHTHAERSQQDPGRCIHPFLQTNRQSEPSREPFEHNEIDGAHARVEYVPEMTSTSNIGGTRLTL